MDVLEPRMTGAPAVAAFAAALVAGLALSIGTASAGDCGSACRDAYNQCRIKTKGAPSCDEQYTRCMQSCRKR